MSHIIRVPLTYAYNDAHAKLKTATEELYYLLEKAPGEDRAIGAGTVVNTIFNAVMSQIHEERKERSLWRRIKRFVGRK